MVQALYPSVYLRSFRGFLQNAFDLYHGLWTPMRLFFARIFHPQIGVEPMKSQILAAIGRTGVDQAGADRTQSSRDRTCYGNTLDIIGGAFVARLSKTTSVNPMVLGVDASRHHFDKLHPQGHGGK